MANLYFGLSLFKYYLPSILLNWIPLGNACTSGAKPGLNSMCRCRISGQASVKAIALGVCRGSVVASWLQPRCSKLWWSNCHILGIYKNQQVAPVAQNGTSWRVSHRIDQQITFFGIGISKSELGFHRRQKEHTHIVRVAA